MDYGPWTLWTACRDAFHPEALHEREWACRGDARGLLPADAAAPRPAEIRRAAALQSLGAAEPDALADTPAYSARRPPRFVRRPHVLPSVRAAPAGVRPDRRGHGARGGSGRAPEIGRASCR